jgi:nickel/cobalt transporter (NicO) family protein
MPPINNEYQDRINFTLLLTGFLTLCGILLAGVLHWQWLSWQILQWQGLLHKEMAVLLRAALSPNLETKIILLGLCFLYGVFHAVGPGHGKAVLSTYLATHNSQLKRAMWISLGAALMQALVAILLMTIVAAIFGWTQIRAQQFGMQLDQFSFWLVALLGGYLSLRAAYRVYLLWRNSAQSSKINIQRVQPMTAKAAVGIRDTPNSSSSHVHSETCGCGHAHTPDIAQLNKAQDWRGQLAIMLTMGIRPCTGALLILVLAKSIGLFMLGIAAVLLMALGTAGTVCLLAWFSHSMRHLAIRLLSHRSSGLWLPYGLEIISLLGGILLIVMGYGMAQIVTTQVSPFFMPH